MKIAVLGADTLANVTALCCGRVVGVVRTVEPDVDLVWACYDTPIGDDDKPDVEWVCAELAKDLDGVLPGLPVLLSSQVTVGTTAWLQRTYPGFDFICVPENIRVKYAEPDFMHQARIVVGRRTHDHDVLVNHILRNFTEQIIWTTPETAETIKHAINCWLGLTIAFTNEMARVAEAVGANAVTVLHGLKTDRRVSPDAPMLPGPPFGGGHLARDIYTVNRLIQQHEIHAPLIAHITESNR